MEGLFVLRSINFNYREGSGQGGLPKEKWKASFLTTTATMKVEEDVEVRGAQYVEHDLNKVKKYQQIVPQHQMIFILTASFEILTT